MAKSRTGSRVFVLALATGEHSVNVDKFTEYLDGLRAANPEAKIALFMDNLSAHTSERAKKAMRDHGFRYIYNVPYSPDYNPIELVFS